MTPSQKGKLSTKSVKDNIHDDSPLHSSHVSLQGGDNKRPKHLPTPTPTIAEICTTQSAQFFEGDVLVTYGPACKDNSTPDQKSSIAHVDLIDREGQMTITANLSNKLIDKFMPSLLPGKSVRIQDFQIKKKSQFERGDANYCLLLTSRTKIETISPVCSQQKLTPDTTVYQLIHSLSTYPIGTLGVLVPSHRHDPDQFQLQIRDGEHPTDLATFIVPKTHTHAFKCLEKIFVTTTPPQPLLLLLKNVIRSGGRGSAIIRSGHSTFIDILHDEYAVASLHMLASTNIQVTGLLHPSNVHLPPYHAVCTSCQQPVSSSFTATNNSTHCTTCTTTTTFSYQPCLQCTIETEDSTIECSLHGTLLAEYFPELTEIPFDKYTATRSRAVHLMRKFQVQGTFTLAMDNSIVSIATETHSIT